MLNAQYTFTLVLLLLLLLFIYVVVVVVIMNLTSQVGLSFGLGFFSKDERGFLFVRLF